jgi:hypothetical protein
MLVSIFWIYGLIFEGRENIHITAKNPKNHFETSLDTTEIIPNF